MSAVVPVWWECRHTESNVDGSVMVAKGGAVKVINKQCSVVWVSKGYRCDTTSFALEYGSGINGSMVCEGCSGLLVSKCGW